jgi:hypothetical protein
MKLWIARDEETAFCRLFSSKPEKRYSYYYECFIWTNHKPNDGIQLELYAFPEVTFENSPMEVELKLIEK